MKSQTMRKYDGNPIAMMTSSSYSSLGAQRLVGFRPFEAVAFDKAFFAHQPQIFVGGGHLDRPAIADPVRDRKPTTAGPAATAR